jgi:hypothetical protein
MLDNPLLKGHIVAHAAVWSESQENPGWEKANHCSPSKLQETLNMLDIAEITRTVTLTVT